MERPKHKTSMLPSGLFLFFTLFAVNVRAQTLPPAKIDGFVYKNIRVNSDTIVIEAFYDPVCPDSRDSWPPLKQALRYYGSRAWLVVHLFPLPSVIPFFFFSSHNSFLDICLVAEKTSEIEKRNKLIMFGILWLVCEE